MNKKKLRGPNTGAATDVHWEVVFDDEFRKEEFTAMDMEQRRALIAAADALENAGPTAGRPLVGTLDNPTHPNMKELRYDAHSGTQVWRAAFAFDPHRKAVVLIAGDKQGEDEVRFYKVLIKTANKRYAKHLKRLGSNRDDNTEPKSSRDSRGARNSRRSRT